MQSSSKFAGDVPVFELDRKVAEFLVNEINYVDSFKSDYVLVEYKEEATGKVWHVLDGYFTLKNQTVLFS